VQHWISLQRRNFVRQLARCGQLPVSDQGIPVQLYPRLHQSQLLSRQISREQLAIRNRQRSLKLRVLGMDMGQVVVGIINQIHSDDNAVKHRQNGHGKSFLRSQFKANFAKTKLMNRLLIRTLNDSVFLRSVY
jgi:hypothetical protein